MAVVRNRRLSTEELSDHLFGDPRIPEDHGIIGRLERKVETLTKVAWSILIMLVAELLTVLGDLLVHH